MGLNNCIDSDFSFYTSQQSRHHQHNILFIIHRAQQLPSSTILYQKRRTRYGVNRMHIVDHNGHRKVSYVLAHHQLLRCSAVRPPIGVLSINAFEFRMVLSVVREKGTRDKALHLLCHARLLHDACLTFFLCG